MKKIANSQDRVVGHYQNEHLHSMDPVQWGRGSRQGSKPGTKNEMDPLGLGHALERDGHPGARLTPSTQLMAPQLIPAPTSWWPHRAMSLCVKTGFLLLRGFLSIL